MERPLYIERLKPFVGKSLIKVLVGKRRVGKSYLLILLKDLVKNKVQIIKLSISTRNKMSFLQLSIQ